MAALGLIPLVSDGEFIRALAAAAEKAGKVLTVHLKIDTGSGAVAFHPDAWLDMVRPGILLYGYGPKTDLPEVNPVMELRTRIVFMKRVKPGEAVSYGRTWALSPRAAAGTRSRFSAPGP